MVKVENQIKSDSSGMTRELKVKDVFIFNVLGFSLGVVLAVAPTFLGNSYPGANPYLVLLLGTGFAVLNGYVYSLFAAAMPVSGGEYTYISRTLGHHLGFVASWGFSWSQFLGLGVYTAWCVQTAIAPAIISMGYSLQIAQLITIGKSLSVHWISFLVGTLLLSLIYALSIRGFRILKQWMNGLFWIAIAGTIATIVLFLQKSPTAFVTAFNEYMETNAGFPDARNTIIHLAHQGGAAVDNRYNLWDTIMALPVGYWFFIGFTYSAYIGAEVKRPDKSQRRGIMGALLFGFVMYLIALWAYYSAVGRELNNAISYIQGNPANPFPVDSSVNSIAAMLTKNPLLHLLMGLGNIIWYLLLLVVMVQVCSRNLYSWANKNLLPAKLTSSDGLSPFVSVGIVTGMAIVFLGIYLFAGLNFINYIAIFSVAFLITGIAAIRFASARDPLFRRTPAPVQKKVFGIYLMKIAGIGNTVLFLLLLYSSLTNTGVSGTQGWLPVFLLAGIYCSGFVVYGLARQRNRKRGITDDARKLEGKGIYIPAE